MISAEEALARLKEGNKRFVSGDQLENPVEIAERRSALVKGQSPYAIVLGCSDSRVPAEIIFDQGLGDLFVVRVAGNIAAPSQVGSIEFAAQQFGARLVVVLGHTACGAVSACISELEQPSNLPSPNLRSIVEKIQPAVEPLMDLEMPHDSSEFMHLAVRSNVIESVSHLRQRSEVLTNLIANQGLKVVGAEYSLESGRVEFFERLDREE